jgi:hypothetical protein
VSRVVMRVRRTSHKRVSVRKIDPTRNAFGPPMPLRPLPQTPILFSILVPTVPGREVKLARLLRNLDPQVSARSDVELLVLRDNRKMSIGEKRTRMIALARGTYVAFVDDDDDVMPDYVSTIAAKIAAEPSDVICFAVLVRGHGPDKPCYFGRHLHANLAHEYRRKPNHLMVWRRDIAATVPFPQVNHGEDTAWADAISPRVTSLGVIDRLLYVYQYDPNDNSSGR